MSIMNRSYFKIGLMTSMAACTIFASSGAWAEDATSKDTSADSGETVVVTGTRIRRPNLTSTSPITTIDKKELQYQGVLNLEEALNRLPQVRADSTQFTNGSDSDGRAKLNLRNLGWQRSLVLLDGQRLLPVQAVDLNIIPSALVQRVDVLTGGASATYGSDAIAGVANFILNKSFNGIEINGSLGGYQHNNDASDIQAQIKENPSISLPKSNVFDGQRTDLNIAAGKNFADGRGNISIFLDQRSQDAVTWSQRDYSACRTQIVNGVMSCVVNTSYSPYGRYTFNEGPSAGQTLYGAQDGSNTLVPYNSSYAINTREKFNFLRSDERFTGGVFGHFKFNEAAEVYGTYLYMKDESSSQFYPALVSDTIALNCDNPYMSTAQAQTICGSAAGTSATVSTTVNYELNGPGSKELTNTATNKDYRMTMGLRGDFADVWHYDIGFVGSQVVTSLSDNNEIDDQKFINAAQVVNVNGKATCLINADASTTNDDPSCVPANIFGYHTIDEAFYNYAYQNYSWSSTTQQQTYTANLSGDLTGYGVKSPWADNGVAVAVGLEYRRDSLRNEADQATRDYEGWLSTVGGHYGVKEAYMEFQIPLIANLPFVHSLDFNTAFRQSKYDNLDRALGTSKYEIQYRPIKDVLVRASFNNAQRAPNISELYGLKYKSINGSLVDACAGADPTATAAQCANTGVTAAQYGTLTDCGTSCYTYAGGGNTALKPEEAETLTYGLVYTPSQVPGLSMSADYYDILIKNYIGYLDAVDNFNKCLTTGLNYYCQYIHRGTDGSFTSSGGGYVEGGTLNTYRLHNRGIDFQAAYAFGIGKYGRIDMNFTGTALSITGGQDSPLTASVNCAGYFGNPTCYAPEPKWRHNLRATWQTPWQQSTVSVNWRHIGGTLYTGNSSDTSLNGGGSYVTSAEYAKLPDYDYIDLSGSMRVRDGLTLNLSVNNLFDLTPPITVSTNVDGTSNNPNTWTGTYDALGRSILLSFKLKL
jgi:iron complex outermembrane receptor protein